MIIPPAPADFPASQVPTLGYDITQREVTRTVAVGDRATTQTRRRKRPAVRGNGFAEWWGSYVRGPRSLPAPEATPIRIVDLFSSVGGLSLGAMEAAAALGMRAKSMLAADTDARALQVYKRNLRPRHLARGSVRGMLDFRVSGTGDNARFAYEPTVLDEQLSLVRGKVDLLLAGPPCQGHSSLNNHTRYEDPKNLLYLTVPAAAVALGARHIVIENVVNVMSDKHGAARTAIGLLRDNGYRLSYGTLAADKLGWPQTRRRFFVVASRDSTPVDIDELGKAFVQRALPVSWLLDDLDSVDAPDADVVNTSPKLSEENAARVDWLFDHDAHNLPNAIRPDCHKEGTTYGATYGRMYRDRPAPTITGGFLTPGRGRFIHPTRRRVLTPREAARVQGFPDWFDFVADASEPPTRTELGKWIGNAVPSLLGFAGALAALSGEAASESGPVRVDATAS